jgi:hypothetical protein
MKSAKAIKLILSLLLLAPLGGCFYLAENHPTTESRQMTPTEQQFWADRQSRQEKAEEWRRTLERQSSDRLTRYFTYYR